MAAYESKRASSENEKEFLDVVSSETSIILSSPNISTVLNQISEETKDENHTTKSSKSSKQKNSRDGTEYKIQGWVMKRSEHLRQWRHRYAILNDYELYFTENPFAPPHVKLDLRKCTEIRTISQSKILGGQSLILELHFSDSTKVVSFEISKANQHSKWFDIISKLIGTCDVSSSLINAAASGDLKTAENLLNSSGVDVNCQAPEQKYTALIAAVMDKNINMVRLLLNGNADPNVSDSHGRTAIAIAMANDSIEILELLLENGAKSSRYISNNDSKLTPLHVAVDKKSLPMIRLLAKAKADITKPAADGRTPLICAMLTDQNEAVQEMLTYYETSEVNGRKLIPAVFVAIDRKNVQYLKLLIKAGAEINKEAVVEGATPLLYATQKELLKIVEELLQAPGIDINKSYRNGYTPIFIAANNGSKEILSLLIKNKADLNIPAKGCCNPFDIAMYKGHTEIAHLLQRHGGVAWKNS
eukprot:gene12745-17086_t